MRLDKTIILVLVSAFIIGAVFFALYEFSDDTLTVAINPEGGVSQTEELNNCERYVFSIVGAADIDLSDEDVSWNINGEWHNEEVAEEPFREQGPQQVKLYVDGKLRADTTVVVGACDVASLIVPSNIVKGETHVLNGTTKNAVGYKWFMNGEVQSDRDGDDSKLTYKFKRSADYEVKVEVTTEDGETKVATRQLQVDEPKKEPVKYAETKPVKKPEPKKEVEKRQENIPIAEPVERYVPPVEEKKEEPVVIEKKPEVVEEKYVPSGCHLVRLLVTLIQTTFLKDSH